MPSLLIMVTCGVDNCNIKHNTLLHSNQNYDNNNISVVELSIGNKNNSNETQNINTHSGSRNKILFKMLSITIFGQNNKSFKTFAFIESV